MRTFLFMLGSLFVASAFCGERAPTNADPLVRALTSYNWSWENYASGTKRFEEIQFYQGGFAENPRFFTARWEVTGPRTVTLYNDSGGAPGPVERLLGKVNKGPEAYLVFDESFTRYVGIDFNGKTNVEGFRRESLDPDRLPVDLDRKTKVDGSRGESLGPESGREKGTQKKRVTRPEDR